MDEKGAYDISVVYSWICVYDPGPTCALVVDSHTAPPPRTPLSRRARDTKAHILRVLGACLPGPIPSGPRRVRAESRPRPDHRPRGGGPTPLARLSSFQEEGQRLVFTSGRRSFGLNLGRTSSGGRVKAGA